MLQGDGIKKTYREKTELDRNIECKGAYSVAEFVYVERIGDGEDRMKGIILAGGSGTRL